MPMTLVGNTTTRPDVKKFCIRGVDIAAIDIDVATNLIKQLAINGQGTYVTVTGAHGIVESVHSDRVRDAHAHATLVVPDGMPIVWLGRLLGFSAIGRVYGPDLMASVFSRSELRELKHFFYGSTPAVIETLISAIKSRFGEFNLVGIHSPPLRPAGFEEDQAVISHIRQLRPNIIWVGLSTPKQEIWLLNHMQKIGTGVGIGVGAAFDLLSGLTRQAPRWIQRSGCEWLFRLVVDPKRLIRRYAFVVPRFLYYMAEALIRHYTSRSTNQL
jgi:N-acetylglucosaminyldiphosphoundecaprenol N-acetyl-beta-D-mannosaminyltransferase